ncbi:MAG: hypothetical protein UR15_C0008G0001 [Parcubacteria group bacterium GW2011_GWA2_31_28]|nr:MAG: hypothetical protein UR15_C0008G0001 [Parcubacteria group bacterium GW2011_GWA2_31_28]
MVKGEDFIHGIDCPENWMFPNWLDWKRIKNPITDGKTFVAYSLPDQLEERSYLGEYGEVFFGEDGQPRDFRRHSLWDTTIRVMKGMQVGVRIHEWPVRPLTAASLEIKFDPEIPAENAVDAFAIASADYSSGRLESASFGKCFANGSDIRSPSILVGSFNGRFSFNPYMEEGYQYIETGPNQIQIQHDGNPEFDCSFQIRKIRQGFRQAQFFILRQVHLETGHKKTLVAPLQLNMKGVIGAAYAPLPKQSQISQGYEPVWKDIDRIINMQLFTE